MSGEECLAATGGGCLLLYVRGAGVAAGDSDGDVIEAASSMEEADQSGSGEHAAGGVPESGDAAEDDGVPAEVGGGVPAVAGGGEAVTAGGVPAAAGGGEAISNDTPSVGGADAGGALHPPPPDCGSGAHVAFCWCWCCCCCWGVPESVGMSYPSPFICD